MKARRRPRRLSLRLSLLPLPFPFRMLSLLSLSLIHPPFPLRLQMLLPRRQQPDRLPGIRRSIHPQRSSLALRRSVTTRRAAIHPRLPIDAGALAEVCFEGPHRLVEGDADGGERVGKGLPRGRRGGALDVDEVAGGRGVGFAELVAVWESVSGG